MVSVLVTYSDGNMSCVSSERFRSSHFCPTVLCSMCDSNALLFTRIKKSCCWLMNSWDGFLVVWLDIAIFDITVVTFAMVAGKRIWA